MSEDKDWQACLKCKGEGKLSFQGFTSLDGKVYPSREIPCHYCEGKGKFHPPDFEAIKSMILARQGKNKGKLKRSYPSPVKGNALENRAYYVWRIARWHGGVDNSMPMTADMLMAGDPFRKDLDPLCDELAKENFGSHMRQALRWGRALGMI